MEHTSELVGFCQVLQELKWVLHVLCTDRAPRHYCGLRIGG